jgi:hypothetical protein
LIDLGGAALLQSIHNSPSLLLSAVYPDYDWLPWKFETTPRNFWESVKNKRKYLDWLGKQLGIKEFADWYKITAKVCIYSILS